jgi:hypothetical protein
MSVFFAIDCIQFAILAGSGFPRGFPEHRADELPIAPDGVVEILLCRSEQGLRVDIDCQQTDRNDRSIASHLQSIAIAGFPECGVLFSGQTRGFGSMDPVDTGWVRCRSGCSAGLLRSTFTFGRSRRETDPGAIDWDGGMSKRARRAVPLRLALP